MASQNTERHSQPNPSHPGSDSLTHHIMAEMQLDQQPSYPGEEKYEEPHQLYACPLTDPLESKAHEGRALLSNPVSLAPSTCTHYELRKYLVIVRHGSSHLQYQHLGY